jgi:RHS repeat-associated protein
MKIYKKIFIVLLGCLFYLNLYSQDRTLEGCETIITTQFANNIANLSYSAGSFNITVETGDNCDWGINETSTWVNATTPNSVGDGTVHVTYFENPLATSRSATITIEGNTVTINQAGNPSVSTDPPISNCPDYTPKNQINIAYPMDDEDCKIYDGVIQARDKIDLTTGFHYSANNDAPVIITADANIICEADYITDVEGSTRILDKSTEVGSLPGSVNVSALGAASYTIPISIPQGTAGIQPNLSISYNSQMGKTKLGKGFNLGGLSAITRVHASQFFDNETMPLSITANDRFSLDGNRLIVVGDKDYGIINSEYRTEQNTFAKVTFVLDDLGSYYKVISKDGRILEYGNTADSRLAVSGTITPLAYYLNKVTDRNGNYMEYSYEQEEGEIWIKKIDYTGNVGFSPYNSIVFYYDNREDEKVNHIADKKVMNSKLLREISVFTNNKLLRKYNFEYFKDNIKESCLNKITESNGSGENLNSTIINWGQHNVFNFTPEIVDIQHKSTYEYYKDRSISSYDANGDGLSDLIRFFEVEIDELSSRTDAMEIYYAESDLEGNISFNRQNNQYYDLGTSINWEDFIYVNQGVVFADLEGDGNVEVIVPAYEDIVGQVARFKIKNRSNYKISLPLVNNVFPLFTYADLNNNGRDEIITLERKYIMGTNDYPLQIGEVVGRIEDENINTVTVPLKSENFEAIFTGDYNNDGLIDVRFYCNGNSGENILPKVITYLNIHGRIARTPTYTCYFREGSNSESFNYKYCQGDFNGDGLLDLLVVGDNNKGITVAYGGTYSGSDAVSYNQIMGIEDPHTDKDDDENNVVVTDFNNDGLSDFILFESKYKWTDSPDSQPWKIFDKFIVTWYRATKDGFDQFNQTESNSHDFAQIERFTVGDFNGDGYVDFLNKGFDFFNESSTTDEWRFYSSFNNNFEANKVTEIFNGFGHKTEFKYRPLSFANKTDILDFYIKGNSSITDVVNYQVPLYVVSAIKQPDGKGNYITNNYSYEGLRSHINGRGLLGFEKIKVFNESSLVNTITTNKLDDENFVLKEQTSEILIDGVLTKKNVAKFEVKKYTDNPNRSFNQPKILHNIDYLNGLTSIQEFTTYDDYGNVLTKNDSYYSQVIEVVETPEIPELPAEPTAPECKITTTNAYSSDGSWCDARLTSSSVYTDYGTEPETNVSTYSYDSNGNLLTNIASDVTVTNSDFDQFGNPKLQTTKGVDGELLSVSSTFDATGRFVKTSTNNLDKTGSFDYNQLGQLISEEGVDGLTTTYTYDAWGNLESTTSPLGITTNYSKEWLTDGFYTLVQTTDFPDIKTYYDNYGRKIGTETTSFGGLMRSDIVYNNKCQVEKTISPHFASNNDLTKHETLFTYDQYGRATIVSNNGLTNSTEYIFGSTKVIETLPSGKTKESVLDAIGNVKSIKDGDIQIDYTYHSNGQLETAGAPGSQVALTYDTNGNRDILTDPDAGEYDFDYDSYGRLKTKSSPIGNYSATFLEGRLKTEIEDGNNISYTYVESGNGINQIDVISDSQGEFQNFDYDEKHRISNLTERVGDLSMTASYTYDKYGRNSEINYPEGFGIKYIYDINSGELVEIQTNEEDLIWKLNEVNEHGQITKYEYGNGLQTVIGYDGKNFLKTITTGTIQNLIYTFDAENVVLDNRTGLINGTTETFTYDDLNQLTDLVTDNKPELNFSMTYSGDVVGRMQSKSDIGVFDYTGTRPHAITDINTTNTNYAPEDHDIIHYTTFGKVEDITQGDYKVKFTYGPDHSRKVMEVFHNNTLQRKVYYFGNYERHEEDGNILHLYYIYSANGLTAIYKKENSNDGEMFYVHKDHLGSIQIVTDSLKQVQARYYYNAWGVKSNLDTASGSAIQANNDLIWLHRGFTGHEHITEFGLINMNGRVYDADLGIFISPDPHIQAPDNPVNFNRYAYCLNNPLVYTDPDGEFWNLVISAAIGGVLNVVTHWNDIDDFGDGIGYFAVGAVAGAVGAGVGSGVSSALASSGGSFTAGFVGSTSTAYTIGFTSGAVSGAAGGFASGFLTGFGNAALNPENDLGDMFGAGINYGIKGAAFGGITGGITSGIVASNNNRNFWTGARRQNIYFKINANNEVNIISEKDYLDLTPKERLHYSTKVVNNKYITVNEDNVIIKYPNEIDKIIRIEGDPLIGHSSYVGKNAIRIKIWEELEEITLSGWRYTSNSNVFSLQNWFHRY